MNRNILIANALLWAAALVAAASVGAPTVLTLILLPTLASVSLIISTAKRRAAVCRTWFPGPIRF